MAELAKKLHFLKNGTEQTAKAYSTVDEAGDNYAPLKIDGVACYAPIGATDDAMATNGRVIKGGSTYAIKSQAKPAYTEISYTTAGTHTFTVPNGVNRLRVAVCGGGGGSLLFYNGTPRTNSGTAGGTSYFGSTSTIQATGGSGATATMEYYDNGEATYTRVRSFTAGTAGSPNGNAGTLQYETYYISGNYAGNGGSGFALSFSKGSGSYGTGGTATGYGRWGAPGGAGGGGGGGYNTGYVDVTPNNNYTVVVGSAGTSTRSFYGSNSDSGSVTSPTSGFVLIAYGGDI